MSLLNDVLALSMNYKFHELNFLPFLENVLFCLQVNSVGSFIRDLFRSKVLLHSGPLCTSTV